jgi:hypothetical protein
MDPLINVATLLVKLAEGNSIGNSGILNVKN